MTTQRERYDQLVDDHEWILHGVKKVNGGNLDDPLDAQDPEVQAWYERFTKIKDRMYELAYDLGVPFELGGEANAEQYAATWNGVVAAMNENGNRRAMR